MEELDVSDLHFDNLSTLEDDIREVDSEEEEEPAEAAAALAEHLLKKCHLLLYELEEFEKVLAGQRNEVAVEIKPFRNSVRSELKSLENVSMSWISSSRYFPSTVL